MFCIKKFISIILTQAFNFIKFKSNKTIRLKRGIINISQNLNSISTANIINNKIANIGKNTI